MIDFYDGLIFLVAVALGAWVQAISGFALGLIVIAIVQLSGSITIIEAAAAISILAFANISISLIDTFRQIDRQLFTRLIIGQIPAIGIGVWILGYLSSAATTILELIFGLFLIASGLSLSLNPKVLPSRSGSKVVVATGFAGGIFGGMFAASGPVIGWFAYRQPLEIPAIRASLLAMLGVTTVTRTLIVSVGGVFTSNLLAWVAAGIPIVIAATYLAKKVPIKASDRQFRRLMFLLVLVTGLWIVGSSVWRFSVDFY